MLESGSEARASGSEAKAAVTQEPYNQGTGPGHGSASLPSQVERWPQPRKRMSQTVRVGPRPRPAPSLGALRLQEAAVLPAEVVTAAAWPSHCAPGNGSPSVLLGAGNRGLGSLHGPGLRLRDSTAADARPISMATGFLWRGPRRRGCPVAPVRRDSPVLAAGGLGPADGAAARSRRADRLGPQGGDAGSRAVPAARR